MPTDTTRRLGYGGSAVIDGVQVLITGGSMDKANQPSYLEMMDIPPSSNSRSRVLHADGTSDYSGSINFDVTVSALGFLTTAKLLARRYAFSVGIDDGSNPTPFVMSGCYLTSLQLSGAPGGLITASLSFLAKSGKTPGIVTNSYLMNYSATPNDQPLGYWWSGATNAGSDSDVRDWSLTMNQAVEAMYLNEDSMEPRYLKVGLIDYSMSATMYAEHLNPLDRVIIATSAFILTGVVTEKGYSFGGPADLGTYSHSFVTAADAAVGAGGVIIT